LSDMVGVLSVGSPHLRAFERFKSPRNSFGYAAG
jgi:hypothetical protein